MNMRKIFGVIMIFILSLSITGCFNYKDINRVTFVTAAIMDIDPEENILLYLECIKPYRSANESSDRGKKTVSVGRGKTFLEAIRDVNKNASYKLNFTQNRALIFTENAAIKGIKKYVDLINRNQEFSVKPYLYIYYGQIEPLLAFGKEDDEYLGLYLDELTQKTKDTPRVITKDVNSYLTERIAGNGTALIGGIKFKEELGSNNLELFGGGILQHDELVKNIDVEDTLSYNIINNRIKTGTLEIKNPQSPNEFITLEIVGNKTKTDLEYDGNRLNLYKTINVTATIAESQDRLLIDNNIIELLKKNEKENMKQYVTNVFNKYKEESIDIFNINRLVEQKYPYLILEDTLGVTDLILNVDIDIEGTTKIKNTY